MNKHQYRLCKVADIVAEAQNVITILLDKAIDALPAHFVMVWLPGVNEKPFALAYSRPLGITLKDIGPFSHALFQLKKGDTLRVRGPYGNSFLGFADERKKKYLVAGGTGAAPLAMLAEATNERPVVFLGGRTSGDLVFADRFSRCAELFVSTNDGSAGAHGNVTDIFDSVGIEKNSQFFVCGPEKMMRAVCEKATAHTSAENIFCSLEKFMKCSRGICGQCDLGGYRVCTDGPVFSYAQLLECPDFGVSRREITGRMVAAEH